MPEFNVNVFLQNNDYVRMMEARLHDAEAAASDLRLKYRLLESHYADVQHVNIELTDLLRLHGIRFRKNADIRTWE